jgi:secondary thiamine-phosphate synthase enzyme
MPGTRLPVGDDCGQFPVANGRDRAWRAAFLPQRGGSPWQKSRGLRDTEERLIRAQTEREARPFLWVSDPFGEFSVFSQAVRSLAMACARLPRRYDRLLMTVYTDYLWFNTAKRREIVRITDQVASIVEKSQVKDGMALVSAMHITAGVYVNDWESGLIDDIQEWVEQLAPARPDYRHHQTGEDNADAHLKRTLVGHQVILPITRGALDLGPWEQVFYAEFDGQRRKRVIVKVMGQ